MEFAGVSASEAGYCWFLDDSVKNLKTAKEIGWRTVLVGLHARGSGELIECADADFVVDTLSELSEKVPALFETPN